MIAGLALALLLSSEPVVAQTLANPVIVPQKRSDAPTILSDTSDGYSTTIVIDLPSKKTYYLKFDCGASFVVASLQFNGPAVKEIHFAGDPNIKSHCFLLEWVAQ